MNTSDPTNGNAATVASRRNRTSRWAIAVGFLVCVAAERQSLAAEPWPLGKLTLREAASESAPDGYEVSAFEVTCPRVEQPLKGALAVAPHRGTARGLVMFFTGGKGTRWWAGGSGKTTRLAEELRDAGFVIVQVKWDDTWHHSSSGDDAGTAHLACRPATVIKYVHEKYYRPLEIKVAAPGRDGFCITGNSGGASQVAYALSHYGLDEILDVVIPTGGPPHAALAKSMLDPASDENAKGDYLQSAGYGYPESTRTFIDKSFGYFDNNGPGRRQDADFKARWDEESVATGGNDYEHPKTRVHFIFGEHDRRMQTVGRNYFERLKKEGSPLVKWELAADTKHSIIQTAAGRTALKAAILGIDKSQPVDESDKTTAPPKRARKQSHPADSEAVRPDNEPPAAAADTLDWDKAKRIYRKRQSGEELTDEERAYLDRARAARSRPRRNPPKNGPDEASKSERPATEKTLTTPPHTTTLKVVRFDENPIIRPEMLPGKDGKWDAGNICGPSLIRVPDWVEKPLGKYYLYFAHHKGSYIRLAYAERLEGPWTIHQPGTLKLENMLAAGDYHIVNGSHIASPDVHVDDENKQIRMYFHAQVAPIARWGHNTGVAVSKDGLHFQLAAARPIGEPYFRVFQRDGWHFALDRTGNLNRSRDGLTDWKPREDTFPLGKQKMGRFAEAAHDIEARKWMRHAAVKLDGDVLSVFFTRTGDAPESILLSTAGLSGDWTTWKLSPPVIVLEPQRDYEGANLSIETSRAGSRLNRGPIRAVQDPCIFREGDRTFLLYSVAGENGVAIAELKKESPKHSIPNR